MSAGSRVYGQDGLKHQQLSLWGSYGNHRQSVAMTSWSLAKQADPHKSEQLCESRSDTNCSTGQTSKEVKKFFFVLVHCCISVEGLSVFAITQQKKNTVSRSRGHCGHLHFPIRHIKRWRYSGGGLIWCFDALFDDGQLKVEDASVMSLHWRTWKASPGPWAEGYGC